MKYFALVWSSLKRKKTRTILTLLALFIAFLLYGVLCAVKEALTAGVSMAGADRLIVRHKVSLIMNLPVSYQQRMLNLPGVDSVTHFTWFNGIYKDEPKNFFGSFPFELESFLRIYPEYSLPEDQKKAFLAQRNAAIVGRSLLNRFKWKIGDRVSLRSPIWLNKSGGAWDFDIVGVFDAKKKNTDTSGFYFRYDFFDEGRVYGTGMVGWYGVRVKDPNHADAIAKAIDNEFANSAYETKAEPEGAFMQGFAQQMGNIGAILIGILSAVFFIILLVAGNTMSQSVRERIVELGVLKATGFTNELVLALVLAESCLLAAVGGAAGLLAAWAFASRGSPVPQMLPVFYLPARYIAIGAGIVLALGLVAGMVPALQAMRLQIAVALRKNG
jgi:putative ABC transport system permease protein